MVEKLPKTQRRWHVGLDERLPGQRPDSVIICLDTTGGWAEPYWHVSVAGVLVVLANSMIEGMNIPIEPSNSEGEGRVGKVIIRGNGIEPISQEGFQAFLETLGHEGGGQ